MARQQSRYGVVYVLLDGNETCGNNLYGYCKTHKGLLSYRLACTHDCLSRGEDGGVCKHFIKFERYDKRYKSALRGEDFRNSLGKRGKRKGEREKRTSSDTVSKVARLPCGTSFDHSDRSMEQARNLQIVRQNLRLKREGSHYRILKGKGQKSVRRRLHSRVVSARFDTR